MDVRGCVCCGVARMRCRTAANRLVMVDVDWNPAVDNQGTGVGHLFAV